jgi:hypothetical protein
MPSGASNADDNLPEVSAFFQMSVRVEGLLEGKHPINHWRQAGYRHCRIHFCEHL